MTHSFPTRRSSDLNVQTFAAKYDPDFVQTIQNATPARGNAFGVAGARLPIAAAAGKRVKLSGYIRTDAVTRGWEGRSEEHTSELQSLMRISYAVFCLKKKRADDRTRQT